MRQARQNLGCLYSAAHISRFFRMAVTHIAVSMSRPFDFILASQRDNDVEPDFVHQVSRDALMTFIASSIMLDAYSLKMHGKTILTSKKMNVQHLTKIRSLRLRDAL